MKQSTEIIERTDAFPAFGYLICSFCDKIFSQNHYSDLKNPRCLFCTRHDYQGENILRVSFLPILGYYWFNKRVNWPCQIMDYLESHRRVGLLNPYFNYDEEEDHWFIDFSRNINPEDALKTIINILVCFNLPLLIPQFKFATFYKKFAAAVLQFHTERKRPKNRKLLMPTFRNCMEIDENSVSKSKSFRRSFIDTK